MRVTTGDLLLIKGHAGDPDLHMEVVEAHGANGAPPWRVRWGDEGHEGLLFPGPETTIQRVDARGEASSVTR